MFPTPITQKMSAVSSCLSLQDLLDDQNSSQLSDYLAVSVTHVEGDTLISLTTTGAEPLTYATVIPAVPGIDLESLVFIIQSD